ncbi:MAG TPA: hypothetical protein GXX56_10420 [Rhodocyclaceae bacterium]|nr:hypothetical protein [Rhodocyclaceae bacterium]
MTAIPLSRAGCGLPFSWKFFANNDATDVCVAQKGKQATTEQATHHKNLSNQKVSK